MPQDGTKAQKVGNTITAAQRAHGRGIGYGSVGPWASADFPQFYQRICQHVATILAGASYRGRASCLTIPHLAPDGLHSERVPRDRGVLTIDRQVAVDLTDDGAVRMAFQTPEQHDREGAARALDVILHMTRQIEHVAYFYSRCKSVRPLRKLFNRSLLRRRDLLSPEARANGTVGPWDTRKKTKDQRPETRDRRRGADRGTEAMKMKTTDGECQTGGPGNWDQLVKMGFFAAIS